MTSRQALPDDLQRLLPLTPAVFFVLFSLSDGAKHGYAIMQETNELSSGKVRMGPGTLYSTLQRLLDFALINEVRGFAPADRDSRRRYYRLTASGKTLLEAELRHMDLLVRLARVKRLVPRA
jgi:DNA-binding PadR family transcriptional regulator